MPLLSWLTDILEYVAYSPYTSQWSEIQAGGMLKKWVIDKKKKTHRLYVMDTFKYSFYDTFLNGGKWWGLFSCLPSVVQRILLTHASFLRWQQYSASKAKPYSICIQIAQLIPVTLTLQFVNKYTFPLLTMAMIKHFPLMIKILKSKSILITMTHWGNLYINDF